jgi:predicted  nucleic acid-binding Zn-ribbon protein
MEMSMVEAMNMSSDDTIYRCPNCKRMLIRYRPEVDQINEEYNE